MHNGVNAANSSPPAAFSASQERSIVWLLGLRAAVHVFLFSAAFPFFNNVDEQIHFDLAVKYSQGHVPRALERVSPEATPYVVIYGTHEYLWPSNNFPIEQFPPPWTQPMDKIAPNVAVLGGRLEQCDQSRSLAAAALLYACRFVVAGRESVRISRRIFALLGPLSEHLFRCCAGLAGLCGGTDGFPGKFLRLGVPALLAFFPQTAFYSIQNDVLSPLCFGAAFLCLVKFLRADIPGVRLGAFTGLALAATFLTKISNLPLLAVSASVVLFKIVVWRRRENCALHYRRWRRWCCARPCR